MNTLLHRDVQLSRASIWIFYRHNLQGDNQWFSRQRMIEIEQSLLRQDPDDPRTPACAILYSVAFPGIEGQVIRRNGLNFGFGSSITFLFNTSGENPFNTWSQKVST